MGCSNENESEKVNYMDEKKLDLLALDMTSYYRGEPGRVQHFLKVHELSRIIGRGEGMDEEALFTLETAAYVHDIGIKPAEEKYNSCSGKYQEELGPHEAGKLLSGLGFDKGVIERVCFLVGHHHTYNNIEGLDYQILVEADFLVNIFEENEPKEAAETVLKNIFRTKTGIRIFKDMYLAGQWYSQGVKYMKLKELKERLEGCGNKEEMESFLEHIAESGERVDFGCNVFLIGFMGAGKSTIAKSMGRLFGLEVTEMDALISKKEDMSIPEIFEKYGEPYFREKETELLIELQSRLGGVVSCGGGVPMLERNVIEMKKNGRVVLLTAEPETILERVKNSHDRPLIENNKTVPYISGLMEKRREKYEAAADVVIATDGKSVPEICIEIVKKLS